MKSLFVVLIMTVISPVVPLQPAKTKKKHFSFLFHINIVVEREFRSWCWLTLAFVIFFFSRFRFLYLNSERLLILLKEIVRRQRAKKRKKNLFLLSGRHFSRGVFDNDVETISANWRSKDYS